RARKPPENRRTTALSFSQVRPKIANPAVGFLLTHLVLRAVIAHWEAHMTEADPIVAWSGFRDSFPGIGRPKSTEQAWAWWSDAINAALRPLHPRVQVTSDEDDAARRFGIDQPSVGAYTALMAQLVNLVVHEVPWQRCANEKCGKAFVRQSGRAAAGQNRSTGL
ncbi:MAG TPA: hypothetical protein VIJ34_09645, partial [Acidimicrobiales bacterium]